MDKITLLGVLLTSLFIGNNLAVDINKNIDELRIQFEKEQVQKKIIQDLAEQEVLQKARIKAFKVKQECRNLGIDCETGKKLIQTKKTKIKKNHREKIREKIKNIQEEQKLANAQIALKKKQEECFNQGLDCGGNYAVFLKQQQQKQKQQNTIILETKISNIKTPLPNKPNLVGFFNQSAIFKFNKGKINTLKVGHIINEYKIDKINVGLSVVLTHPNHPNQKFTVFLTK